MGVSCADYRRAGAFAEYIAVPSRIVYRLPDDLSFAEAAMLEAVAVAVHAISLAQVSPSGTALVLGAGMIGLLVLQALRVAGCSRVFVADIDLFAPQTCSRSRCDNGVVCQRWPHGASIAANQWRRRGRGG